MKIQSVYRDYIQKSKLFLYPLLDIKRGVSVTPIQTYMALGDHHCFTDSKLICHYHIRDDQEFKLFEDVKLIGNPFFHDRHLLEDGTGIYVFDLSSQEDDFWKVVKGQYSQLSAANKKRILNFFTGFNTHHAYIESYLNPEKYYSMYSQILNVKVKYLKEAVELLDKPDLEQEELKLAIKIMNSKNNTLNLQSINQQNNSL